MNFPRLVAFPALVALFAAGCASQPQRSLPTAHAVQLDRYMGHWYEIARLPNFFQHADGKATAHYTLQSDGTVKVVNTEFRPNHPPKAVTGAATVVPQSGNGRLKVKFGGLAALAPVSSAGNYWIIEVAPDYSVALVGTPDRKFLWLLARQPHISKLTEQHYLDEAHRLGFQTRELILSGSRKSPPI
jgi:apolipoprotein D and lipocalin family protein